MPKGPIDETKLRTGEEAASALSEHAKRYPAAAADGPTPGTAPFARAPAPLSPAPARRKGPGGIIAGVVLVAIIAGAIWYFFFR